MTNHDEKLTIDGDTILGCVADILPNAISVHKYLEINSDTMLNSIADGLIVVGLDRKVKYANRAAREILGLAGDSNGENGLCAFFGDTGCEIASVVDGTIRTGEPVFNYEAECQRRGGKLSLSINTVILKDGRGRITGAIEIFRDITLLRELKEEVKSRYYFSNIISRNTRMIEVFELLTELAPTKTTVLIEGETGTGKELIANAVHHNSDRKNGPFIKVNCAALPEGLLESELFGHVKGAFTSAVSDRAGRFELANRGTLFLDEIGDITPRIQAKLLRVLQSGEFERVGSAGTLKTDARIITATNKDLRTAVEKGEFRDDLYYRLKVVPILLPPLRERKDDIPLLVRHFIEKFNREMGMDVTNLSHDALDLLMGYGYPGNIRELEHIIEYAFIKCSGRTITADHLPQEVHDNDIIRKAMSAAEPLKALEKEMILRVLDETGWKYSESARKLQISRSTLWRKMKELDIEKSR